jgi:hypothetical protein
VFEIQNSDDEVAYKEFINLDGEEIVVLDIRKLLNQTKNLRIDLNRAQTFTEDDHYDHNQIK